MSSNGRILVVEDDFDTANLLKNCFIDLEYSVEVTSRGREALMICHRQPPDLILLDIMLPDIDGYEVCRKLRSAIRTKHTPVIFLTQKDKRSDCIAALELGADDYITKPFDIEELKLRVQHAIQKYKHTRHPQTGLPNVELDEDELLELALVGKRYGTAFLLISIDHMQPFVDKYGFGAADEVLRFTSLLIRGVVNEYGTISDSIGHTSNDTFVVITGVDDERTLTLSNVLRRRFDDRILNYYSVSDAEQGGIRRTSGPLAPLMSLNINLAGFK